MHRARQCGECVLSLDNTNELIHHKKDTGHGAIICPCGILFFEGYRFETYSNFAHPPESDYKCLGCGLTLRSNLQLTTHIGPTGDCRAFRQELEVNISIDYIKRTHQCLKCETSTKDLEKITWHYLTKHTDSRLYKCGYCGKSFQAPNALIGHWKHHPECQNSFQAPEQRPDHSPKAIPG